MRPSLPILLPLPPPPEPIKSIRQIRPQERNRVHVIIELTMAVIASCQHFIQLKTEYEMVRTVSFGFGRQVARVGGGIRLFGRGFLGSAVAPREPRVGGSRRWRLRLLLLLLLLAVLGAGVVDDRVDHRLRQHPLVQRPAHDDRTRSIPATNQFKFNLFR